MNRSPRFLLAVLSLLAFCRAHATTVINEIMFHPLGTPAEDVAQEWIELRNTSSTVTDNLTGWSFSKGVNFTFPAGTVLGPGAYLVVAADVAAFLSAHPGFAGQVVGGWEGKLSNSGEEIQLDDATGAKVNDVFYAKDGEWALRGRGAQTESHQGWEWFNGADGGGRTIELRNPALGNGSGQNWGVGGSPGAVNAVASANVPPLIKSVKHLPEVPHSTDPIAVSCVLEDEVAGSTATLRWRLDGAATFAALPMTDPDGDGRVAATIPAQANLAIVEWYISATDATALTRTWPAPTRTSEAGVLPETFGQVTNALVQVDNNDDPNATFLTAANNPVYRIILTAAERNELVQLQTTSGQEHSAARFNGTFISRDGTGVKVRYNCAIGNRGQTTALGPPNNYHVGFSSDAAWNGRGSLSLNSRFPYSQALGSALYARAGIPPQDTAIVKVRLNGADLAFTSATMYGRYARVEGRGSAWAANHFPNDPDGNFYRLDYHYPSTPNMPPGNLVDGEFRYEGLSGDSYADTFIKENNTDANDFSDLVQLCKIVSASRTADTTAGDGTVQPKILDADYPAAVATVLDLDETYRFFAVDALIGNMEGGLQSGGGDDASLYRGVSDSRFKLIPHDLDTIFDIGDTTNGVSRNVFSYDGSTSPGTGVLGLTRLFTHPLLVPRYYAALLEGLNTWFNSATIDPMVDQIMAGWVPATDGVSQNRSVGDIKAFVTNRRTSVLAQIPQTFSLSVTTSGADTAEGYKQTTTGAATFSGAFHVAKTYSITVNGVLATPNYRSTGSLTAGTWSLAVPGGGGSVLAPGLNRVVVNFWDAPNGTGNVVQALTANVFYNTGAGTTIAGTLTAGSLRIVAPASYIPGKPFLVRVDQLDGAGNPDRTAWDTTVTLSSNVGGISLPTVPLYNGSGSALVTAGGSGGGGGTTQLIIPGGTPAAPNANASDWRMLDTGAEPAATWKSDQAFVDTAWTLGKLQAGAGDGDERTTLNNVPGSAANTRRAFYFRKIFNVTDPAAFTQLVIKAVVDDGAVFYLNGTEVYRDGMAAGTPTLTTPASGNRTGAAEAQVNTFDISAYLNLLVPGNNLLAVEVHNYSLGTTYSVDLSFDCELDGVAPSADPGTFTLTAAGAGFSSQKTIASLTATPAMTLATGTLSSGTTTWSGVVHVTGDVTVTTGSTLNIAAGTIVLVDGDAGAGSTTGKRIIVTNMPNMPGGTFNSQGTLANPVTITAFNATDRWGGFSFSSAQPSTFNYTLLNHAGHTTGVGHTGKGPMVRIAASTVSLLDTTLADGPAKAIYTSGASSLTIRRSLIERMITGPELEDGCSLLCEDSNIQHILPDYRESNDALANDEDCLYVHNNFSTPNSIVVRRSVFARCGDDVVDNLGGPLVVEDSILREGWDKGLSLLNNDLTISNTQIIRCDKAIAMKSQNADVRTVTATNCTIVSENHDSLIAPWGYTGGVNGGDPDTASTGFYTQNKAGQSNTGATLAVTAKNCIVIAQVPVLVDAPYAAANTVVTYSDLRVDPNAAFAWPGTGNITADPLFVAAGTGDFHLSPGSPARNTGDPASPLDADGSRADMGALPYTGAVAAGGTITWTPGGGPYRVTGDTTVPAGTTLVINAGTSVLFDQNRKLTVNGTIKVLGTDAAHVVFSNVPGTTATDPITGIAGQPAKWAGVVVVGPAIGAGPAITGSEFRYCNFFNAQPAVSAGNTGSLGIIRAFALIDHCIFLGTHLRQVYGENCALQVQYSTFVDPFDPANNADNPVAYNLDNIAEPLKVANANVADSNYVFGLPVGGYFRVWYNEFRGNKGHNDVFDADSGGFNTAAGVNNTNPILDCRYNNFLGLTGDEHIDLGGDAYVAGNVFQRGHKDVWTNDHGYSNCISSGDKSGATTIWVARNIAFNVDHVMNCKASTATIFEYNTVANFNADFSYASTLVTPAFTQDVRCSAINQYVPDDTGPTRGDGAYIAGNIFHNIPRVVSWADLPATAATKLEAANNYINGLADNSVGPVTAQYSGGTLHPGGFTALGAFVQPGDPQFVNEAGGNYALKPGSPARGTAPGGFDYGASTPEWVQITGGPGGTTNQTGASFTVGGAAMVAYKWRLDGSAWSAVQQIGNGLIFPRGATPTVRTGTLTLNSLAPGGHTLEVVGRDPAGNWQDTDLARTVAGLPPLAPTARTWTVDPTFIDLRLSEILADSATLADSVELQNTGSSPASLTGWSLTNDPLVPGKLPIGGTLAAGAFATFSNALLPINKDGDTIYLYRGGVLVDAIAFGAQITDRTIGRHPATGAWGLCAQTPNAANTPLPVADFSSLKITEWLASSDVLYTDDWVEFQNTGANPVALAGLRFTENRADEASAFTFPALSFVGAGGYLRLTADSSGKPGHLPFKLDAEYETLTLLKPDATVLDTVSFYPQTTDFSLGRDAVGNLAFYELPTRGFLNGATNSAYANALEILRHLRITEIMYNAIGGSDFDYVELTNTGATPLALAGVALTDAVTFTFPAMTLNPGEYVIVARSISKFRSRYGNAPVVAGNYSGQLDNGGETITLLLPPPFDAAALSFAYSDAWYAPTDGLGASLVIPNALGKASAWRDRETWAASAVNGGNPGGVLASLLTYSGFSARNGVQAITDDTDRDSVGALMEFSLGMNIANPNAGDGVAGLPLLGRAADGRATLRFLVPENAGAAQSHGFADVVYRVQAADGLGTWTTIATKSYSAPWNGTGAATVGSVSGGYMPVTITDVAPLGLQPRFLRLQMNWVP